MQDEVQLTSQDFDLGRVWNNRFANLGPAFFSARTPTPVREPYWVARSQSMARELGLEDDWWRSQEALEAFSGNRPLVGSRPLASVYSGHQFGVWAGQLGDGRAIMLGEVQASDGNSLELQLKGSGSTPYSRMGDGRAVLRSTIREFLCSEAMHALGIPSTRALCMTGSDQPVRRETLETAAVLARTAPSFIRFGHFEHFSHTEQHEELKKLTDFVIDGFYPECRDAPNPAAALLAAVTSRTAALMAGWQAVGFCHGVMNTDNMSILGLTLDYGPFQFMDGFDPNHIPNHTDTGGRYSYKRQPQVAYWNLFALGQALLPLIGEPDETMAALEPYKAIFPAAQDMRMAAKLGFTNSNEGTSALINDLLALMAKERTDYPIFWRRWAQHLAGQPVETVLDLFHDRPGIENCMQQLQELESKFGQQPNANLALGSSPAIVLRNHLAEQAIALANQKDFSMIQQLLDVLENPFSEHPNHTTWAGFPPDWASSIQISCSS
ncbi:protein adenylyltransferase SelO [Ottowia thiooxydans]|uniref:protein adenylyltransferase SelO n=1 Tax=Ottowia thiooxydans TaxID=219182 RepID=UPI00056B2085|nr:YdiU family protein [Ottowia thiooxydans]